MTLTGRTVMHYNAFAVQVCISLMLFCLPSPKLTGETIGYAWPKSDLLIPDTSKGEFKPLQVGRRYELVKQIATGYVVVWENTDGSPRLALIPFRDRLGNSTVHPYEPSVTLINATGIDPKSGFIALKTGERYPVVSRDDSICLVVFTCQSLTQTVTVADTNITYVSLGDYTGVLKSLASTAEAQIVTGASPESVEAKFINYTGRFATETAAERTALAKQYKRRAEERDTEREKEAKEAESKALEQRKRQFKAEQTAKGLVEFRGEWIFTAEKERRLAEEVQSEEQARKLLEQEDARRRAAKAGREAKGIYLEGDTFRVGYTSYLGAESFWLDEKLLKALPKNPLFDTRPDETFLVIVIGIKNEDKKPRDIQLFSLIDEDGAEYEGSKKSRGMEKVMVKAFESWKAGELTAIGPFETLNPGSKKDCVIVFDVPMRHTYKLKVSGGFWSTKDALIELSPEKLMD